MASLTQRCAGKIRVFAGHGGIEFPLNLATGCAGLIPAPELLDRQVRIYELYRHGGADAMREADRQHARLLTWIIMMTRAASKRSSATASD